MIDHPRKYAGWHGEYVGTRHEHIGDLAEVTETCRQDFRTYIVVGEHGSDLAYKPYTGIFARSATCYILGIERKLRAIRILVILDPIQRVTRRPFRVIVFL